MFKCLVTTVGWKASSIDSCNEIVTFVVNEGIMSYHGNIRHLHFAIREQKENLTHAHVAFFSFSLDSSSFLRSVSLPLFSLVAETLALAHGRDAKMRIAMQT